ncbi:glycosyltransferase [Candidatus Woesebacteria bacterium]|nr:glycosyltransferase [Candidatus Woesebacteria bacterium]
MQKKRKPFFSIVIPTLNEEKYLPLLLKDLSKQSLSDFEVIVVDGTSEDATISQAKKFETVFALTICETTTRNVSYQRNLGSKKARGSWIIFMDADNRLPEYFLTGLQFQLLKNKTVDSFTSWASLKASTRIEKLIEMSINYGLELAENMHLPQAVGALIGCRAAVVKKISFDENLTIFEDGAYVRSIVEAGYTFKIFREPRFFYSPRRIKKEGNLKMIGIFINNQTRYILGGDFTKPYSNKGYPMLGGSYYAEEKSPEKFSHWLSQIESLLKQASTKQLEQTRRVIKTFIDFEE